MKSQMPGLGDEPAPFSADTLREHRLHRISSWKKVRNSRWLVLLTVPLIYISALPFLLLDLTVAVYQLVCFPIYGIPKVRREDYLIFDRGRLAYLNTVEKAGCIYCSYANGLLAYVAQIAGRTEQYFCPIKHAHRVARPHSRYSHFLPYGDARAFRAQLETVERDFGDLAESAREDSTQAL